jgi:hypothetical protein
MFLNYMFFKVWFLVVFYCVIFLYSEDWGWPANIKYISFDIFHTCLVCMQCFCPAQDFWKCFSWYFIDETISKSVALCCCLLCCICSFTYVWFSLIRFQMLYIASRELYGFIFILAQCLRIPLKSLTCNLFLKSVSSIDVTHTGGDIWMPVTICYNWTVY